MRGHAGHLLLLLLCATAGEPSADNTTAAREQCVCVRYSRCVNNKLTGKDYGSIKSRSREACMLLNYVCCPLVAGQVRQGARSSKSSEPESGGYQHVHGQFPWLVAVLEEEGDHQLRYKCGGALVHAAVVLTAAHCVPGSRYRVRAGQHVLEAHDGPAARQEASVHSILIHDEYKEASLKNDLALLLLATPLRLSAGVEPACLPPSSGMAPGAAGCWVAGWRSDQDRQLVAGTARRLQVGLVPHERCQSAVRKLPGRGRYQLHSSFLCTGAAPGMDACDVDPGSPLVCPVAGAPQRYQLVGLVSWGCTTSSQVSMHVHIVQLRHWIDQQMASNQLHNISSSH